MGIAEVEVRLAADECRLARRDGCWIDRPHRPATGAKFQRSLAFSNAGGARRQHRGSCAVAVEPHDHISGSNRDLRTATPPGCEHTPGTPGTSRKRSSNSHSHMNLMPGNIHASKSPNETPPRGERSTGNAALASAQNCACSRQDRELTGLRKIRSGHEAPAPQRSPSRLPRPTASSSWSRPYRR